MFTGILSLIVFLPLAGVVLILLLPPSEGGRSRQVALGVTLATLALAIITVIRFDTSISDPQFVEQYQWIPFINVEYFLGVDGLSMPMVVLTALLSVAAILASWKINYRTKEYFIWMLVLETGVMGVFTFPWTWSSSSSSGKWNWSPCTCSFPSGEAAAESTRR